MSYIQPKTDFQDGEVLYGNDLNASNEVIKAGVDDNFDRIQGLEAGKQDTLTAGTGIEITEDNVINNTQTSAEWGNIQGDITDQTDLVNALNDKQDVIDSSHKLDYGLLSNTPTIPSKTSDLTNDSGFIDNSYHDSSKQDTLVSGTNIKTINNLDILGSGNINIGGGSGGTSDYNELENKPQINNVTLSGNKSLSDLGIDIPTKTSDLTNDSNFVADSNYVHTDNNYTSAEKTKLANLENYDDTNILNALSNKVDKVAGKGLSTEDYTSTEKTKLAGIEAGAQVNVEEIVLDENDVTADTKLIIEESDLDFQGLEIANEYNTADDMAYSCAYVNKFGKLLWSGSFTSGSITVPGLSNYKVIVVFVAGAVYCIGSRYYGVGGIGKYGEYTSQVYNYRCTGTGDTMTIDNLNKGGSNGTQNEPITAIYGLF